MRTFRFILLILIALASVGAAVLLTIDGNLSRIIGRTAFSSGERLFPYTREEMNEVSWMRINCVGDVAEFRRKPNGVWWCEKPWNDRMDPRAAAAILQYTYSTSIVDALPLHKIDSASLKEFGVKTTPVTITLKEMSDDGKRSSTVARYTLGSPAPWLVDDPENKTTDDTTYMQTDFTAGTPAFWWAPATFFLCSNPASASFGTTVPCSCIRPCPPPLKSTIGASASPWSARLPAPPGKSRIPSPWIRTRP